MSVCLFVYPWRSAAGEAGNCRDRKLVSPRTESEEVAEAERQSLRRNGDSSEESGYVALLQASDAW